MTFNITKLDTYGVVLGMPWLVTANPKIDWERRKLGRALPSTRSNAITTATTAPNIQTIPAKYQDYADVFSKKKADTLPAHQSYDCPIDLMPGKEPSFGPIYAMSNVELASLKGYIDENIVKGFIRPSKSPAGAPVLFVKKKSGELRMCVDYRALNSITVKNISSPLIPELLDRLRSAQNLHKIGPPWCLQLGPDQTWRRVEDGLSHEIRPFRILGLRPFGLTNAPAVFQHLVNDVLREFLDQFVVVYLDDILVYSANPKEHTTHVRLVLQKLREAKLFVKIEKCEFDTLEAEFLGHIIGVNGITMDPKKTKVIHNRGKPQTLKELQSFLGFANYYRDFIQDYSLMALPLTRLTKKDAPFRWDNEADNAFKSLKNAFTSTSMLGHANLSEPFIVEADASDFALGAVLAQVKEDGRTHPIAFHSRKFTPTEINYDVYEKELLAIVDAFQQWRKYLEGAQHRITVFSDHNNLIHFTTARRLNRRQARWSLFLADFDFEIRFRPGKRQGAADALSRQNLHEGKEAKRPDVRTVLNPKHLGMRRMESARKGEKRDSSPEKRGREHIPNEKREARSFNRDMTPRRLDMEGRGRRTS